MPLGSDYAGQACSLARTLEVVGERWTLLVLRDLFLGVHRFTDLHAHLDIPRAVLSARLAALVAHGLVERRPYRAGRDEFHLTASGHELWPALYSLLVWGDRHRPAPGGPRRLFTHGSCGSVLTAAGACAACGMAPDPADVETMPGPGADPARRDDPVSRALRRPHRLLTPVAV
ncbi:MAG: winged helix-turn-helix transcriptional regulator [Solirubrobacteraceae bacterium]